MLVIYIAKINSLNDFLNKFFICFIFTIFAILNKTVYRIYILCSMSNSTKTNIFE